MYANPTRIQTNILFYKKQLKTNKKKKGISKWFSQNGIKKNPHNDKGSFGQRNIISIRW